jgi:hypothetical protein
VPATIAAFVLTRFGLLAFVATLFTTAMWTRSPAALEFAAWYANRSLTALIIIISVGAFGARAALVDSRRTLQSRARIAGYI